MLFLLLFIVVVFALLYTIIYKGQEQDLDSKLDGEAHSIEEYLNHRNQTSLSGFEGQELVLNNVDQFFYYITGPDGDLIMGDEILSGLRPDILNLIKGWSPDQEEFHREQLRVDFSKIHERKDERHELQPAQSPQDIQLIIAVHPIKYNGEIVGRIYLGKDITSTYQLFKWLLIILVGLAVLFIGIALIISFFMSKKAMVPISRAFSRQREFVADASHELRTPLSVMMSSINAMEMTMDEKNDDNYSNKLLITMKDEVKRMTRLVGDMLTLARSDSGAMERFNERFDFSSAAEKGVQSFRSLAEQKEIHLQLHAPETLYIQGDSQRLTQLLYILIDNAIKYTSNGGEVHVYLSIEGGSLSIKVEDTGIGIRREDYDLIFERFYRSDKSRSRQVGGHGLGLAIAKWIVETHGGTIRVDSDMGKGSIFTVKIPLSSKTKRGK
ncbi:GHKL domain-containing protein [Falsibacillus albus]|uniref:histidine kinase n=2 Tax=Falsibacillus albus TaxID=2478915 RepID=A0A3L7K3B6_9BACI|nr:GHKL domain-containing protein [Falsibacillus albus]